jgi:hypothetical protein
MSDSIGQKFHVRILPAALKKLYFQFIAVFIPAIFAECKSCVEY